MLRAEGEGEAEPYLVQRSRGKADGFRQSCCLEAPQGQEPGPAEGSAGSARPGVSGSLWRLLYGEVMLLAKELLQGQYREDGWEAE